MSSIRRFLTLLGLIVAVLIGSSIPASATFSEAVAVTTTIGTATIAPPTQVEAKAICTTTVDPVTQTATTSESVKIEWWRSVSPRTTGYRITVYPAAGSAYILAEVGPTDEIFVTPASIDGPSSRVSVTTLTSTGWTAESARTAVRPC